MSDINRVVIAHWKLKKWLDSRNFSKIVAAENALNQIDIFIKKQQIEVIDLTGSRYDLGLSVDVLSSDTDLSEFDHKKFYIMEMTKPIIMSNGSLSAYGEVRLTTKEPEDISPVIEQSKNNTYNHEKKIESPEINDSLVFKSKRLNLITAVYSILILLLLILNFIHFMSFQSIISEQNKKMDSILIQIQENESLISKQTEMLFILESNNQSINSQLMEIKLNQINISDKFGNQLTFVYHRVKKGENLITICNEYSIDYIASKQLILSVNGLNNNGLIKTGQLIILPKENSND
jgi:hypothetical protein